MEQQFTGGSWTMMPNIQTHSNSPAHSNQELQQQQQQFYQIQQQQFNQIQQQQQNYQQFQPQQQQPQQLYIQQTPPPPQQQQQHPSLASHFQLSHLVENLADAIENGTRDQHSDTLVAELNSHFEKCQQLLNSISSSISMKGMTVEGQKRKLEESEQLLNQRRELIAEYRSSVEEHIKSET